MIQPVKLFAVGFCYRSTQPTLRSFNPPYSLLKNHEMLNDATL
jgi:hypothetical protein